MEKIIDDVIHSNIENFSSIIATNSIVSIAISVIVLYFFIFFQSVKIKKYKIEHFNNLKRYIDSIKPQINNNPDAYLIEEGFFCYSGKRLNMEEIQFLLSLKNRALDFIESYPKLKMYLEIKNTQLCFKDFYKKRFVNETLKTVYYLGYIISFGFALFCISLLFSEKVFEIIQIKILFIAIISGITGMLMLIEAIKIGVAKKLIERYI